MFLKKLKIAGFKSFAKPVIIDFELPLTAIVGPNGSGKSNIVDAIRWALGEQSAKNLRGSKMADIIFAGSDNFKPLHKASVTLYLNNREHILPINSDEVRICRQVNDTGQSSYLLNGSICRLKDIEDLLLDTGMGRDFYSIVGQGKIDSILNSKPEKLKELFEEAAGITKHKLRKEEAEKNLAKTRQDLQRVSDFSWELEKRIKPLEKAAEKAQKYQRLQGELEVLEVSLLVDKWEKNNKEILSSKEERDLRQNKLARLNEQVKKLYVIVEKERNDLEKEQEILKNLQNNYYQLKIKEEAAENNLKILLERNNSLHREEKHLKEQLNSLKIGEQEEQKRQVELNQELEKIGEQKDILAKKLAGEESILQRKKELFKIKKEKLFILRNSVLNNNMELKNINADLEKAKGKSRYLEIEINKLINNRKRLNEDLNENLLIQKQYAERLDFFSDEIIKSRDESGELGRDKKELEKSFNLINKNIDDIKNKLSHDSSRLRILTTMEEEYRGYSYGVKNILKVSIHLPGLIGVVADQIRVAEQYELAIETALGGRLQNILVRDDFTAKKGVEFLRKNKGGRATFLPLNMVKGKKIDLARLGIENKSGLLGLAADFVSFDRYLEPIIYYLLGRIIIVSNLNDATVIAKRIANRYKIVTLKGDVINPGGAITGGSINKDNLGLLGRPREIEELKEGIVIIKKAILEEEKKKQKVETDLRKIISLQEEKKNQIQQLEFKKNDLNKDFLNLKKDQSRLEKDIEQIDKDFLEYHNQLGINDSKKQEIQQTIELINNDYVKEKNEISLKEEVVEQLERDNEELNIKITNLKVRFATVEQKMNNVDQERKRLTKQITADSEKYKQINKKLLEIRNTLQEMNKKEFSLNEMREGFQKKISQVEKQCQNKDSLLKEKQLQVNDLQDKFQQNQTKLNELKEKYYQLDFKIKRLEDKNEQIKGRLSDEYEVLPDSAKENKIEIKNYTLAESKVKEFKESIKKVGPINQEAIVELTDLKNRLDYLKNQQQDLLKAKEAIVLVIAELEKNMAELFHKTFHKVESEFEDIFRHLFSGGQAELKLTNPDNLLETGIEIVAQPPGKKLKKLSLMSGGERALTAIALVFAFLKVNPSPIYILDEIDAPLDEANVIKFARFIKDYSQYVQFLLITHNKNMMARANTIYGVTMEESGVSKIVSLKLDEEIA